MLGFTIFLKKDYLKIWNNSITFFNNEIDRLNIQRKTNLEIDPVQFADKDDSKISWSSDLYPKLSKGEKEDSLKIK